MTPDGDRSSSARGSSPQGLGHSSPADPPDPELERRVFPPRWSGEPVGSFPGSTPGRAPRAPLSAQPRLRAVTPLGVAPEPQHGAEPREPMALPARGSDRALAGPAGSADLLAVELARVALLLAQQRVELVKARRLAWACWVCALVLVGASTALLALTVSR